MPEIPLPKTPEEYANYYGSFINRVLSGEIPFKNFTFDNTVYEGALNYTYTNAFIVDTSAAVTDPLSIFLDINGTSKSPAFFYSRLAGMQPTSDIVNPELQGATDLLDPNLPSQFMLWGQTTTPTGEIIDKKYKPALFVSPGITPIDGFNLLKENARIRMIKSR